MTDQTIHINWFIRRVLFICLLFSFNHLNAANCVDVFSSAVQTSGDTLVPPAFQFSSSNSDPSGSNLNLAAGDYDNVDVDNNGSITFTTVDGVYRLDQLDLGRNATANFAPGDYFIDEFDFDRDSIVNIIGTGTVRIYFNTARIRRGAAIASGDEYLILVGYGDIRIERDAVFDGVIYSTGEVRVDRGAVITGAIRTDDTDIDNAATINYNTDIIDNADFDDMCDSGTIVTPPSLMVHYEFNEGTGQTAIDSSGNNRTATLGLNASADSNDPSWVCTDNGFAMEFNRSNASRLTGPSFTPPAIGTVAFWYQVPSNLNQRQRFFGFSNSWEIRYEGNDRFSLDVNTPSDNNMVSNNPISIIGSWVHVAMTTNSTSNDWALYINGVLENSGNDPQSQQAANILTLGTRTGSSDYFNGTIDDFRIYDGNLTPAEIATLAATPPVDEVCPTTPATLMVHYEFNEGTGQTVADSSGNGLTGTLGTTSGVDGTDPTWVCTNNGFAMEFDASNSTRVRSATFTPPADGAFAFWYKIPAAPTSRQRIFGFNNDWEIRAESNDIIFLDVNTVNDADMRSSGPQSITDTWIHIAMNTNSATNDWEFYIDGVLDNSGNDPQSQRAAAALSLGMSTWQNTDYFTGTIDDFRIYNGNLTQAEITALAADRPTDICGPVPVAYYEMEEPSWGTVTDSIGGFDGSAFNGANTTGDAACRYGEFDGVNDYVEIPHSPELNGSDALTYVAYIRPDSWTGVDQIIAKSVHGGGSGRAQMGIFSEGGVFKVRAETVSGRYEVTSSLPATAGDWIQVAAVFDGTSLTLYQDAIEVATTSFAATTLNQNNDPVNISKRVGSNAYYFDGLIDEVRIYTEALTQQEILDLFNTVTPCPLTPAIDHIEITTDGNALTCTSEALTLRACANAACTVVANEDVIVDLAVTGSNATFSSDPVTIPANSTSGVQVSLTNRVAETVTLSITSSSPAATGPLECSNVSCDVSFADSGFILSAPNTNSCTDTNLTIQAVRLSDNSQTCAPAYTGDQSVNFEFNYANPASGTTIPSLDGSALAAAGGAQNRTINFDANAQAILPLNYNDAGQLSITVTDGGSNGLSSAATSTIFTPDKLLVTSTDTNATCVGPDYGNCSEFRTAGVPGSVSSEFNLTIAGACADDSITANFELAGITLSSNLIAPSAGNNASLGVTNVDVTGGSSTISQTISEVGAFSITATPGSYLGTTIPAATSETFGRFTPHHFEVSNNGPMLDNATCDFTYQGQETSFAPGLEPEITMTAVNSAGVTTTNYGGAGIANNDFWKLGGADFSSRNYANQAALYPGSVTANLDAVIVAGQTDYNGINTFTFETDTVTHNKAGVVPEATNDAPFDADVSLTLNAASLTDSDGISYDSDNNGTADAYSITSIGGTNIRWGRWLLENGVGSELQALAINATAQYYDGSQFITAITDSCSQAPILTLSNYSGNLANGETTVSQTPIAAGIIPIIFTAPGATNTGSVLLTLTTPSWLQYDYDGDNSVENAQGTATFGIFQGKRPVIIKRQDY